MDKPRNCKAWSSFPHLRTADELEKYFDVRTQGHKEFCHYTTLGAIDSILGSKTIRISSVDRFNDKIDRQQFDTLSGPKMYYSLCFSTGTHENLSLWYLYSGVNGKGARISLTYNKLNRCIKQGRFYLTEYDYINNKSVGEKIPLNQGKNMSLVLRDVLYSNHARDGTKVDLKYNTMTNHGNVSAEELEKFKSGRVGFNKGLIWYYEKETRLLIELIGDAAKLIEPDKDYAVLWELTDKLIKKIKITCAPEISDGSELDKYSNIKKFMFETSKISLSKNAGEIEMNICSKCTYKKEICSKCKYKNDNNEGGTENDKANY